LHKGESHNLYSSPITGRSTVIKSKRTMSGAYGSTHEMWKCIFAGRLQWKRSPGRSRCLWEDNIKMDPAERVYEADE